MHFSWFFYHYCYLDGQPGQIHSVFPSPPIITHTWTKSEINFNLSHCSKSTFDSGAFQHIFLKASPKKFFGVFFKPVYLFTEIVAHFGKLLQLTIISLVSSKFCPPFFLFGTLCIVGVMWDIYHLVLKRKCAQKNFCHPALYIFIIGAWPVAP